MLFLSGYHFHPALLTLQEKVCLSHNYVESYKLAGSKNRSGQHLDESCESIEESNRPLLAQVNSVLPFLMD